MPLIHCRSATILHEFCLILLYRCCKKPFAKHDFRPGASQNEGHCILVKKTTRSQNSQPSVSGKKKGRLHAEAPCSRIQNQIGYSFTQRTEIPVANCS